MPEWERTVRDIFEEKGAGRMRLILCGRGL